MSERLEQLKDELIKFYTKPNSLKATARHFNLPITTCRRYLRQLGITFHSKEITDNLQQQGCKLKDYTKFYQKPIFKEAANFYLAGHSLLETSQKFNINRRTLKKVFIWLNVNFHSKEETFKLKVEKAKKNNLIKYGVENYVETEEFKEKAKKTNLERYGETCYTKTKEYLAKEYLTKSKNKSFNISSDEEYFYKELLKIFNSDNVMRQYKEVRYPFACDFYIKSLDLFIELNINWTHGFMPFNENLKECLDKLVIWKEKAKTSNFYKSAIKVWTKSDPLKLQTAKENNLNYITIYKSEDLPQLIISLQNKTAKLLW